MKEFLAPDFLAILEEYKFVFLPIFFFLGSSIASFYFNLSYRISVYFYSQERKRWSGWKRWKQILTSPSECENCETPIGSSALVPFLGYFLSKGRCPHCGYAIPVIYPIGEFLFGLISMGMFLLTKDIFISILFLLFSGQLLVSAFTDFRYFSLDYENLVWIIFWGMGLNLLVQVSFPDSQDFYVLLGFFGFFLIIHLFYPKGLGFGDVLFAPFFAFVAGHPWWLFFLNASYIPAVVFTILLRKKGQKIREIPIPMGVYFCLGLFLTMLAKIYFIEMGVELNANE